MSENCLSIEIRKQILDHLKPEYVILLCRHITDHELQSLKDLMTKTLESFKSSINDYQIYVYKFLEGIKLEIYIELKDDFGTSILIGYEIDLYPEGNYTILIKP